MLCLVISSIALLLLWAWQHRCEYSRWAVQFTSAETAEIKSYSWQKIFLSKQKCCLVLLSVMEWPNRILQPHQNKKKNNALSNHRQWNGTRHLFYVTAVCVLLLPLWHHCHNDVSPWQPVVVSMVLWNSGIPFPPLWLGCLMYAAVCEQTILEIEKMGKKEWIFGRQWPNWWPWHIYGSYRQSCSVNGGIWHWTSFIIKMHMTSRKSGLELEVVECAGK